jgi:hypothetical protein
MGLAGQGLVGTLGFAGPNDAIKKNHSGFVNPMNISHIADLAQRMGMENPYDAVNGENGENEKESGFGDEFNPTESNEDSESLKNENELLKKELSELKAMLGNKQ